MKMVLFSPIVVAACAAAPVTKDNTPEQMAMSSATPLPSARREDKSTANPPLQMAQKATSATQPKDKSKSILDQAKGFAAWKRDFMARAIKKGYAPDLVKTTLGPARINPKAIHKDRNQPEHNAMIWNYVDNVTSKARLEGGQKKLTKHAALFDRIEETYGVDRYILTAIWGLESLYGEMQGEDDMIDSLSTLAFDGRRRAFAENQLYAILDLLARGDVRKSQLIGSWAGAMGMTQFIPTTFRDYAVDWDGDHNKDLWKNEADALASTANYLNHYGWRPEEPVIVEVALPKGFDYSVLDGPKHTIAHWAGLGIVPVDGRTWSRAAQFLEAKLLLPAGTKGPAFLSFKNFDVIKKYNNSTSYALGIHVLAEALQGRKAISRDWPRGDKALTRAQRKALQAALNRQGYDTGGIDGLLGRKSRRAIRAWQRAHGLPADGYVNHELLRKILLAR